LQRRKNIGRLVEAFEAVGPEWRLALAGSGGYGAAEILRRIDASPARGRIEVLGYVPAEELARLYARARIFAFPSLDEGFGIPVLEAMAAGAAVVASNRSALPEVSGDAALLIDPFDTGSITHALIRLTEDENLRMQLQQKGWKRAAEFPWQAAIEGTWAIYRKLLD
jgi:glycosyltransferase involved in cell wall biosynthesis